MEVLLNLEIIRKFIKSTKPQCMLHIVNIFYRDNHICIHPLIVEEIVKPYIKVIVSNFQVNYH